MKRKRGRKKRNFKGAPGVATNESYSGVLTSNTMDNSDVDEFHDDEYDDSVMEVDTPFPNGDSQLHSLSGVNPDGAVDQTMGKSYSRVKVKLKKNNILDSQCTSSDARTNSDTDKSSQQVGLDEPGRAREKIDDSANSLPGEKASLLENPSKKVGSIKIKALLNQTSNVSAPQVEISRKKDPLVNFQEPQYNKQELEAALEVIKKIMKMDAAEPFNVPVNPVALGIPDYFDIIDTPMDFGTIRSNLENGVKYMNSEDVYKDVEYIWDNCSKYNSKGDYIMDLMKRVKKNFMKYWTAAGLYSEQPMEIGDCFQAEDDMEASGPGKLHEKGGYTKQKAHRRGGRHHKDDCLCAICVLVRRRIEREENERLAKQQAGVNDSNPAEDFKLEESFPVDSHYGEDSSSNMDESVDLHADEHGEVKEILEVTQQQERPLEKKHDDVEVENGIENHQKDNCEILKVTLLDDQSREGSNPPSQSRMLDKSSTDICIVKGASTLKQVDGSTSVQLQKQEDMKKRRQKEKVLERLSYQNPLLLSLCGALFPDNPKSIWAGPHSLAGQHSLARHYDSARKCSIHEAIETFMK